MLPDRALSVYAPWAWALIRGWKPLENRAEKFQRLPVGTTFWLHAGVFPGRGPIPEEGRRRAQWSHEFGSMLLAGAGRDFPLSALDEIDRMRGHIIGRLTITGYATPDAPPDSTWYVPGSLAILVRDPVPLARHVASQGSLGWWRVPAPVLEQLKEAA